jgi:GNAT superfamily N-acetyltransferase
MSGQTSLEIRPLNDSDDFYARDASYVCVSEIGHELLWQPETEVYAALAYDGVFRSLIGMSQLYVDRDRSELYIARMAIVAEWQGQGIGALLMNHAVEVAIERGCGTLSVQATNSRNAKFYGSHGFKYDPIKAQGFPYEYRIFRSLKPYAVDT